MIVAKNSKHVGVTSTTVSTIASNDYGEMHGDTSSELSSYELQALAWCQISGLPVKAG